MTHSLMGKKVKDTVTGFTGIVTAVVEYISGCVQLGIQPVVDKDGKKMDSEYFDEQRVEAIDKNPALSLDNAATTGFGDPAPKR